MGKLIDNNYHLGGFYNGIPKTRPFLYKYQYILEFVQGGGYWDSGVFKKFTLFDHDDEHPEQNFTYWAGGADIPAFTIPAAKTNFYATEFRVPAVQTYGHSFKTTIWLDQDLTMYNKLDTWLKIISRLNISGGGIKVIPTVKLRIRLLDSEHQYFTHALVMEGCYIKQLDQIPLKYGNGETQILKPNATFSIQYYYWDNDAQDLGGDPLSQANILLANGNV